MSLNVGAVKSIIAAARDTSKKKAGSTELVNIALRRLGLDETELQIIHKYLEQK